MDLAVFGKWLDSRILMVFSNLNDSMILSFHSTRGRNCRRRTSELRVCFGVSMDCWLLQVMELSDLNLCIWASSLCQVSNLL